MRYSRRWVIAASAAFVAWPATASGQASLGTLFRRSKPLPEGSIAPSRFTPAAAVAAINEVRAERDRPRLALDGKLTALAAHQARELVSLGVMTHAPRGQQLKERAARIGYRGLVAENLADGYETFEEAIRAWLASDGHRTTMLHRRYSRFGAAVAVAPDAIPGERGIFWVTEFGADR